MNEVVLYQPEIPPNTGNIIRLCSNTNSSLSLIEPLGFELDNKQVRRAGLDYHETTNIRIYKSFEEWLDERNQPFFTVSTRGKTLYHEQHYTSNCILMFGPETRGLPQSIREHAKATSIKIPMAQHQRSINLSNAVAICLFEVLRKQDFLFS
jgi:tRNA (cytidine/uridine-2'-O-)-methyltransferase